MSYKGTGDMALAVVGNQIDGAVSYTPFAISNKGKVRALAVAMDKRHPLLPDVPTFKELGWTGLMARTVALAYPNQPRRTHASGCRICGLCSITNPR